LFGIDLLCLLVSEVYPMFGYHAAKMMIFFESCKYFVNFDEYFCIINNILCAKLAFADKMSYLCSDFLQLINQITIQQFT